MVGINTPSDDLSLENVLKQASLTPERYKKFHWQGNFQDYWDMVQKNHTLGRNAFQYIYDMILSSGTEEIIIHKKKITTYKYFSDPIDKGKDAIFGLYEPLEKLVQIFKSAAQGYDTEQRVLLLHGPVGSSKSTIVRLLKKGLEAYSKTDEGALYTLGWETKTGDDECGSSKKEIIKCPMHEQPLKLLDANMRQKLMNTLNNGKPPEEQIRLEGNLCPVCDFHFSALMNEYDGDWKKVLEHVVVMRFTLSEKDRRGIGTFQPKDEKNQDSTELTGDINYRKIAKYGSDSDPRAFNFDGEFQVANRGIMEFVEVLKLDVAFLYDLLGASQEHKVKPKKFAQIDIDEVIIGHTNEPEYKKLKNNEFMEALRDRTIKIDVPYVTKLSEEIRIYKRDFDGKTGGKHIAPHTIDMAAMWAVLTRLDEPKKAQLTLMQKLKLYDGKTLPGFTEDNIKELQKEAEHEGMGGISPRYIQDKISNALVHTEGGNCVNPFMVLNELEKGLQHHSLITSDDTRRKFKELLATVKEEYEDIVKNEVQKAISADEEAVKKLCGNYIDNLKAYTQKEKVKNKYTGQDEEPDERLMRSVEEKINIPENRKDDFRREIMNYIGAMAIDGKIFNHNSNERLQKALELKLFEDQKDSIKLTSLVSTVVDQETQAKINVVKDRLVKNYGYCDICATDVLNFVASIFARGDVQKKK